MGGREVRAHLIVELPSVPAPDVTVTREAVVAPPATVTVETERKPILYTAKGEPLCRRPIGFATERR
jgi:hypothetical protein